MEKKINKKSLSKESNVKKSEELKEKVKVTKKTVTKKSSDKQDTIVKDVTIQDNSMELKKEKIDFFEIEEKEKTDRIIKIDLLLPRAYIDSTVEERLEKIAKEATFKGFRKGHTPIKIVKMRYLKSEKANVTQHLVSKAIDTVINNYKDKVYSRPQISVDNESDENLIVKLEFECIGNINIPDLKKCVIEHPILDSKEIDITKEVDELLKSRRTFDNCKRAAKKGDKIICDIKCLVDSKEIVEENKQDQHIILGENNYSQDFDKNLIGKKQGDEVSISMKISENDKNNKDIAGKDAIFTVMIKSVMKPNLPTLNDDLASEFKFESLNKMKEFITNNVKRHYNNTVRVIIKKKLFDYLDEELDFIIPNSLIEKEKQALMREAGAKDSDSEKDHALINKVAIRRVKIALMLSKYKDDYKIEIKESDIYSILTREMNQMPDKGQALQQQLMKQDAVTRQIIDNFTMVAIEEKSVDDILNNKITLQEKLYNRKDLDKWINSEMEMINSMV